MSSLYKTNWRDLADGLILTVVGGALNTIAQALQAKETIDLKQIGYTALVFGITYLAQKFTQDENNKYLGSI